MNSMSDQSKHRSSTVGLMQLPDEILLIILKKLAVQKPHSWENLSLTSCRMLRLGLDQEVWKGIVLCEHNAVYWYKKPSRTPEYMFSFYEDWRDVHSLLKSVKFNGVYMATEPIQNSTFYRQKCIRFFRNGKFWSQTFLSESKGYSGFLFQHEGNVGDWKVLSSTIVLISQGISGILEDLTCGFSKLKFFSVPTEAHPRSTSDPWGEYFQKERCSTSDVYEFHKDGNFKGNWNYYENLPPTYSET